MNSEARKLSDYIATAFLDETRPYLHDVELVSSDNQSFAVCRSLLAARSDFFSGLFYGSVPESKQSRISVQWHSHVLRPMLEFLYAESMTLHNQDIYNRDLFLYLLQAADLIQCKSMFTFCVSHLFCIANRAVTTFNGGHESFLDDMRVSNAQAAHIFYDTTYEVRGNIISRDATALLRDLQVAAFCQNEPRCAHDIVFISKDGARYSLSRRILAMTSKMFDNYLFPTQQNEIHLAISKDLLKLVMVHIFSAEDLSNQLTNSSEVLNEVFNILQLPSFYSNLKKQWLASLLVFHMAVKCDVMICWLYNNMHSTHQVYPKLTPLDLERRVRESPSTTLLTPRGFAVCKHNDCYTRTASGFGHCADLGVVILSEGALTALIDGVKGRDDGSNFRLTDEYLFLVVQHWAWKTWNGVWRDAHINSTTVTYGERDIIGVIDNDICTVGTCVADLTLSGGFPEQAGNPTENNPIHANVDSEEDDVLEWWCEDAVVPYTTFLQKNDEVGRDIITNGTLARRKISRTKDLPDTAEALALTKRIVQDHLCLKEMPFGFLRMIHAYTRLLDDNQSVSLFSAVAQQSFGILQKIAGAVCHLRARARELERITQTSDTASSVGGDRESSGEDDMRDVLSQFLDNMSTQRILELFTVDATCSVTTQRKH